MLIPILALASPFAAQAGTASERSLDASSATEIVEPLRERVRRHGHFVARYRAVAEDGERGIVLSYAAPDRARLDFQRGEHRSSTWFHGSRCCIQTRGGARATHAAFDLAAFEEAERTLRRAFPHAEFAVALADPGPVFDLGVAVNPKTSQPALQARLLWSPARRAPVAWLADPAAWIGALADSTGVRLAIDPGGSVRLSLTSGFPDELVYPGERGPVRVRLEGLEVEADVLDEAFAFPAHESDMDDLSGSFERHHATSVASGVRQRIRDAVLASGKSSGEAAERGEAARVELREKLARVHEALHAVLVPVVHRDWLRELAAATDAQHALLRSLDSSPGASEVRRAESRRQADAWKRRIEERLANQRARLLDDVGTSAPGVADPELSRILAESDRAAARRAFERLVAEPLLAQCDEF